MPYPPLRPRGFPGADRSYIDFHSILALSASFVDVFLGEVKISPMALNHLTKAYDLLNKRLSGPEALSDETIAVVTMLALFQRMHQQHSAGLVHFDGLCRMARARGGIARLSAENRALASKSVR